MGLLCRGNKWIYRGNIQKKSKHNAINYMVNYQLNLHCASEKHERMNELK